MTEDFRCTLLAARKIRHRDLQYPSWYDRGTMMKFDRSNEETSDGREADSRAECSQSLHDKDGKQV